MQSQESRLIKNLVITPYAEYLNCQTTLGLKRTLNEDFAAAVTSPQNDQIKLLAVCDGVGGSKRGELASEYTITSLVDWFNHYNFSKDSDIDKDLIRKIKRINYTLKREYKDAGTTLTAALIDKEKTHVINVGDSRTYIIKDNEPTQITKDDSEVWRWCYKDGKGKYTKDELRFLILNCYLTKYLGDKFFLKLNTDVIDNDTYDGLLLLTDGVTDIVSDQRIKELYGEVEYQNFLNALLNEACYGESEFFTDGKKESLLRKPTIPGKDNATAAMYLKRSL